MNGTDKVRHRDTANSAVAKDRGWLQPESSCEIAARDWPTFCDWFIAVHRGIVASLERHEKGSGPMVDCVERPLADLRLRRLENGVTALTVTARGTPRNTQIDLAGPRRMMMQTNAAGRPASLAVAYEDGEFIARFTGGPAPAASATGNSWGE